VAKLSEEEFMFRIPKPKPPTFNGHTFSPSERRAILTAATKGYVFRLGRLGSGARDSPQQSLSYVSLGVLKELYAKGVMKNGNGYAQYVLTIEFRSHCLPDMEYFFTQEAEWLEDRATRKAAAAERKAKREARKAQQTTEETAK
jgi:hypothetical protein